MPEEIITDDEYEALSALANDPEVDEGRRKRIKSILQLARPQRASGNSIADFRSEPNYLVDKEGNPLRSPQGGSIADFRAADRVPVGKSGTPVEGRSIADFRDEGEYRLTKDGSVPPRDPDTAEDVDVEGASGPIKITRTRSAVDTGHWAPPRPLTAQDAWPRDMGGNLEIYHDPSPEQFRRVAAKQREELLRQGAKAQLELQMFPMQGWAPEELAKRLGVIKAAQQAEAQDVGRLDEDSPEYKQFSEAAWADYLSKRGPESGPVRRLSSMTGPLSWEEEAKAKLMAASGGALDAATLGLGAGAREAGLEALEPGAGKLSTDIQEARPWSSAVGAGVMAVKNPLAGAGLLARGLYGLGKRAAGRFGGAALAGAGTAAVEGAGRDVSLDLSDDQDRLDSLGENTALRAGVGAGAGVLGEGLAVGGRHLYDKAADLAYRLKGRPIIEMAEEGGFKLDPLRGIVDSPEAQGYRRAARLGGFNSPGEYGASRMAPIINDAVQEAVAALRIKQGGEDAAYLGATSAQKPARQTWSALRDALTKADSPQRDQVSRKLLEWSELEPVAAPPTKIKKGLKVQADKPGELHVQAGWLRQFKAAETELSPEAQQVVGELEDLPADAWVRLTPRKLSAAEFYAKQQTLSKLARDADTMKDHVLAGVWRRAEAAALGDRDKYPVTKSVRGLTATVESAGAEPREVQGFSALKARQHGEQTQMEADIQNTGARSGKLAKDATPDQLAEINHKTASVGRSTSPRAVEESLFKFAPTDVRKELFFLRGLVAMDEARGRFDTGLTRAGILRGAARVFPLTDLASDAVPGRSAGLGKALGATLPDIPVSENLYRWVNSRIPRSTAFLPGMNVAQVVADEDARARRPKKISDFTDEQRQLLESMVQSGASP